MGLWEELGGQLRERALLSFPRAGSTRKNLEESAASSILQYSANLSASLGVFQNREIQSAASEKIRDPFVTFKYFRVLKSTSKLKKDP